MKTEIKFRGLRTDGKGFVYGSFIHNSIDCPCIIDYDAEQYEVIPESVCQFTGLKDKNGIDIYDGDKTKEGIIIYENGCFILFITDKHEQLKDMKQLLYLTHSNQEVIGNIHEN